MINTKFGMVQVSGSTPMILADLSCVVQAIAEKGLKGIGTKEELKEAVQKAVEQGFEDAEAESKNEDEMGSDLEDVLASFFQKHGREFGEREG